MCDLPELPKLLSSSVFSFWGGMASSDDGGAVDVELIGKSYFCIFLFEILKKKSKENNSEIIPKKFRNNSKIKK